MRILLVEDEIKMARAIRRGLEQEGYAVDAVGDGEEALFRATESDYDGIVLDLMLPGMDGFAVCRTLRSRDRWAPVLVLTARDAVADRIRGLDAGADDYLVKPFAFGELLARLMRHAGEVVSRTRILDHVWDYNYDGLSNVVDVYVGYLRRKLGTAPNGSEPFIRTVRGVGYVVGS
jgi:two-component system OmpR family response regulator